MAGKVVVFGSFVVDLMARIPHLPVPGETVKGRCLKWGPAEKGSTSVSPPTRRAQTSP